MRASDPSRTPLILLAEDDEDARTIYADSVAYAGYRTLVAASGEEALALAQAHPPDLALLDILMPGISGREVAAWLREHCPETCIIFVTGVDEVEVAVEEMRGGAFHYLTKPVRPRKLWETVEEAWAACRANGQVQVGGLAIDLREGRVTLDGKPVPLTALERQVLACLAQRRGQMTSYDELWREVWGYDSPPDRGLIQRTLSNLRGKVGKDRITCVRGRGYRLG